MSVSASEQAFQTLMQMKIMQECPEGLARAHLYLMGWPKATREEVLAAARDVNFGIRELPPEVVLATTQENAMLAMHAGTAAPPSPDGGASRKRARPPRTKTKSSGDAVMLGDVDPSSISSSSSSAAAMTSVPPFYSPDGVEPDSRPAEAVSRRSPQVCQKCHQPRKGHVCTAPKNGVAALSAAPPPPSSSVVVVESPPDIPPTPIFHHHHHHHHHAQPLMLDSYLPPQLMNMSVPPDSFSHSFPMSSDHLLLGGYDSLPPEPLSLEHPDDAAKRLRTQ